MNMEDLIQNRYDFVFLFDVKDGNPNGDPDMDNQPRIDFETQEGLVTDVCIKRKVRNYIQLMVEAGELDGSKYDIFIRQGNILNNLINEGKEKSNEDEKKGIEYMCNRYFDIRTFGAVMSTGDSDKDDDKEDDTEANGKKKSGKKKSGKKGLGIVRGPVQFGFARSVDPIYSRTHSLTRCCITKEGDADKDSTFGNKSTVSYGLYRMHGYISAFDGAKYHFTEDDLQLLWEALLNAFEHDHAAARGEMNARKLIVFKHESKLGNARASDLFDLVKVHKKEEVEFPRSFSDYEVTVEEDKIPANVHLEELI